MASTVMECSTSIPGSFLFDHSLPPKLDISVGATSHFFQPPRTPSASTSLHRSSTSVSSGYDHARTNRRCKRNRKGSCTTFKTVTPMAAERSLHAHTVTTIPSTPGTLSPAPLINTRYQLAGGLDTPTANTASYAFSPDLTCRDGGRWQSSGSFSPDSSLQIPRERNGQARIQATSPNTLRRIIHGVFGIAGQTWSFCSITAFRGFFAGGGKGYHFTPPPKSTSPDKMQTSWQQVQKIHLPESDEEEIKGSLPGGFPDEDFIPDYFARVAPQPPSPSRPTKRIKQGRDNSELRANWVVIGDEQSSREGSPSRASARKLPLKGSLSGLSQPASSIGAAPRALHSALRPSLASYASSPSSTNHLNQRPRTSHRHSASIASTRSPGRQPYIPPVTPKSKRPSTSSAAVNTHQQALHTSPISAEVQRHALKLQKRKREEDASLTRWNAQLTAMIREGKEALGTTFEVHDNDDDDMDVGKEEAELTDEGYGEGDIMEVADDEGKRR